MSSPRRMSLLSRRTRSLAGWLLGLSRVAAAIELHQPQITHSTKMLSQPHKVKISTEPGSEVELALFAVTQGRSSP